MNNPKSHRHYRHLTRYDRALNSLDELKSRDASKFVVAEEGASVALEARGVRTLHPTLYVL